MQIRKLVKIVDKEEFRIKLDQINHLVEAKDYKGAMEVVDSIDWRRVKNVRTLCVVGEIYAANKRYEDSRDIFLLAYHRASIGKNILVRLVEVCLKMNEIDEAMEYYEEFCSVAPNDNTAYILRYKILRAKNAPVEDQIQVLEEYKSREFTEKWSYELAKLYYKAGLQDKAEDTCSEIILWFSEGNYVMKAYELKMKMGVITDSEKQRFEASQAEIEKSKEVPKKEIPKEKAAKEATPKEAASKEKASEEETTEEKSSAEEAAEKTVSEEETGEEESSTETDSEKIISEETAPVEEVSEEVLEKEIPEEETSEEESFKKAAPKKEKFTIVEEISSEEPSDEEETENQETEELPEPSEDLEKEESDEREPEKTGSDDIEGDESEDGEEISEEAGQEDSFEEEEEEDSFEDAEEAFEDDGSPLIDNIEIDNEKELKETETLSERIVKGLRDLFGGRRRAEENDEEEDLEEEEEDELKEEQDEEIQFPDSYDSDDEEDEEAGSEIPEDDSDEDSDEENYDEDIDEDLEEEFDEDSEEEVIEKPKKESKKREFRFLLPRSRKAQKDVKKDQPEEEEQEKEAREPEEEFNLEDTILAAAFEQGIDIPGASNEKKPVKEEKASDSSESVPEEDDEEPVIIEKMINAEEEKSIQSLEKKAKKLSEEKSEDLSEDVPDLIMPDLNSLTEDEDKTEEEIILEKEETSPDEENDDFVAEIVEGENEEDIDEEEFLITGVIGEDDDEDSVIIDDDEDSSDEDEDTIEDFIESLQPRSLDDPLNIIPRSKELTEEEIKLFSYFVIVPGMKEQIVDALYDVQIEASKRTSSAGNIIVMGGPESGKTRLISGLIPAICKELNLEASKVAYVFAEQINGKDLKKVIQRLSGGFLVIENANQLDQETAAKLTKLMDGDTQGMIFILEDDKIGMRKMMARYPKLAKKFTSVINIPVFTNDELANFAKIYAMENGYRIDNKGMLSLYNMISINQKEDMPMNIGAVKEMVDAAISKSQGGIALFRKNASKKRMDQNGFIVLYEKDFVKGK